jgi:hypothetical protein
MSTEPSTLSLLDSLREHLSAFELPEPITLDVDRFPLKHWEHICIHLGIRELSALASALLTWADTLTDVRAASWRPPAADSVHISVHGRLADGTTIRVYSGVSFDSDQFSLEPGAKCELTLGVLREWAALVCKEAA